MNPRSTNQRTPHRHVSHGTASQRASCGRFAAPRFGGTCLDAANRSAHAAPRTTCCSTRCRICTSGSDDTTLCPQCNPPFTDRRSAQHSASCSGADRRRSACALPAAVWRKPASEGEAGCPGADLTLQWPCAALPVAAPSPSETVGGVIKCHSTAHCGQATVRLCTVCCDVLQADSWGDATLPQRDIHSREQCF